MMKKIVCLLIVLTLCLSAVPVMASEEEPSLMEQAKSLFEAEDYEATIPLLLEAADQGDADAQLVLGLFYEEGLGVEQDYEEAVKYYQLAADQEDPIGQYSLAICYFYGLGVEQDYDVAVKLFRLAADQGDSDAVAGLAYCYGEGLGVEEDDKEAIRLYQLAADQGNAYAIANLGWGYFAGEGVEQDYEEAVKYYQLAADQNYPDALFMLGVCYQYGTGVEKDIEKAEELYQQALEAGYKPKEEDEAKLKEVLGAEYEEDALSSEVTQADIEENIIGSWILSKEDGKPVLTNDKNVFDIVSTTEAYSSGARVVAGAQTPWHNHSQSQIDISGNVVTITYNPFEDVSSMHELAIADIGTNEFTANRKFTRVIEGAEPEVRKNVVTYVKVNDDCGEGILGTWEGRCMSEGSVFDDDQEHRWEYKDNGTYVYYVKDGDNWVPSEDELNEYFVAGNLLCMRWMENGQENREWWEITIDGDSMSWTALREDEDGETFTAEFEMERVVE